MFAQIFLGVGVGVLAIGKILDAGTTVYGVDVAKVATEINSVAGWLLSKWPPLLVILGIAEAGFMLGLGLISLLYLKQPNLAIFTGLFSLGAGIYSCLVAKGNAKCNGGWHLF